jgi:hypothetical protein
VTARRLPAAYAGAKKAIDAHRKAGNRQEYVRPEEMPRPHWAEASQYGKLAEEGPGGLRDLVTKRAAVHRVRVHHEAISIGSRAGWPDLPLSGRGGFALRELKGSDGKVTRAQLDCVQWLRQAGVDADFWWPEDWWSGRIDEQLRGIGLTLPGLALPPLEGMGIEGVAGLKVPRLQLRKCGCAPEGAHTCFAWGLAPAAPSTPARPVTRSRRSLGT